MSKRKDRTFWINNGYFPSRVGFVPDEASWRANMKRLGVKNEEYSESPGKCWDFRRNDNDQCILVTLGDEADTRDILEVYGLLVHEATHVMQYMMDNIGESFPSSEFEAYTVQHIALGLMLGYNKTRGKKRKKKS